VRNIFFLIICLSSILSSCDTREDYYELFGEEPIIKLKTDNDSTIDGKKYVVINMRWGEEKDVFYEFWDKYGDLKDIVLSTCTGLGAAAFDYTYYYNRETKSFNQNHLSFNLDKEKKCITIKEKTTSIDYFYNQTGVYFTGSSMTPEASFEFTLKVRNILNIESSVNIYLRIQPNTEPAPLIDVSDTDDPLIKKITVTPSHFPYRGQYAIFEDDIVLYEYNIDGTIIYCHGYDLPGNSQRDYIGVGKAAYNGTYILGTKLSTINHVFQRIGSHVIYVRCQDSWGCWSSWVKKEIIIQN